jgi:hypothetical protein
MANYISHNYAANDSQMKDWESICKAYAKKVDAELLFVNETSCGLQYKDGSFAHIYIEELAEMFKEDKKQKKSNDIER